MVWSIAKNEKMAVMQRECGGKCLDSQPQVIDVYDSPHLHACLVLHVLLQHQLQSAVESTSKPNVGAIVDFLLTVDALPE